MFMRPVHQEELWVERQTPQDEDDNQGTMDQTAVERNFPFASQRLHLLETQGTAA